MEMVPAGIFAPEIAPPSPPELTVHERARDASLKAAQPTDAQLEETEVRLREVLHELRSDVEEAPEIQRGDTQVKVRLWTPTEERKAEILGALGQIPFVAPQIYAPDGSSAVVDQSGDRGASTSSSAAKPDAASSNAQSSYTIEPPLAKALWEYAGGEQPAADYLAQVSDSYQRALVEAAALDALAQRYPESQFHALPSDLQSRIDRIAKDHIDGIRRSVAVYVDLVSPVLDAMLAKRGFTAEADGLPDKVSLDRKSAPEPPDACAVGWRGVAALLVENLRQMQTSFRRLFIEDHSNAPFAVSADRLLRDSALRSSQVRVEVRQLCP
jgi:hypothetical protein